MAFNFLFLSRFAEIPKPQWDCRQAANTQTQTELVDSTSEFHKINTIISIQVCSVIGWALTPTPSRVETSK